MWVDRWQQMKAKKDIYKAEKKLLAATNEKLLKDEKFYEAKNLETQGQAFRIQEIYQVTDRNKLVYI